jgi:hypothetical protein
MKQLTILIMALSSLFFTACEDVIEIDLNSSTPAVVVEGNIVYGKTAQLKLSYTSNYFNNETSEKIEDVKVTLTNSKGETEILTHLGNGTYQGKTIVGEANTKYGLKVELKDKVLEGSTSILSKIELESLSFIPATGNMPPRPGNVNLNDSNPKYQIQINFTDDTLQENYYLFRIKQNNQKSEFGDILMADKIMPNTGIVTFSPMMYQFAPGDTVDVKIYSLDNETFDFYNQLADISGGGMGPGMGGMSTPYNPESNMGYNVLGYFSAWSAIDTTFVFVP